eukprot:gene6635-9109_t
MSNKLPFSAVNLAGDSSEEDEPILPGDKLLLEENSNSFEANKVPVSLLLVNQKDEDEVDEPLPLPLHKIQVKSISSSGLIENESIDKRIIGNSSTNDAVVATAVVQYPIGYISVEYSDSLTAIAADSWDISSWIIYLEEVQAGKGGTTTITEAYNRILERFPRASQFWIKYIEYYINKRDFKEAEELFNRCLSKCRNVDLWKLYLSMIKSNIQLSGNDNQLINEHRKKYELAFEKAIDSIGMFFESFPIWREYLDYVKGWNDSILIETGKKMTMLRKIYQRAVCMPMDQVDEIWNEYELFEKENGEKFAEVVLPEFNKKFLHAKSILRERRKLTKVIVFDRVATPPMNSNSELQQLDAWNLWLRFELGNPDNLSLDLFKSMLRLIYDMFLCCFRYHAEIWISLAKFELQYNGLNESRAVYREGIEINFNSALLRTSFAELEEASGNVDTSKDILKQSFEQVTTGFTFATYQRFVRRLCGLDAARQLFSETLPLRTTSVDHNLIIEIFMAHAKLELEVNARHDIAFKVLNLARLNYPPCIKNMNFIRSIIYVLVLMGDLNQIKWMFQAAIDDIKTARIELNNRSKGVLLRDEYELQEHQLRIETMLNMSDLTRLNELRELRDQAKQLYEEFERTRLGMIISNSTNNNRQDEINRQKASIVEYASDVIERYQNIHSISNISIIIPMNEYDTEMKFRCQNKSYFESNMMLNNSINQFNSLMNNSTMLGSDKGQFNSMKANRDTINMGAEFHLSLSGLPIIIRDLLSKLPLQNINVTNSSNNNNNNATIHDIEGFIRHMKTSHNNNLK